MNTNNKYYFPKIEEIHVGLIVEIYDYDYSNRNDNQKYWTKTIVNIQNIESILMKIHLTEKHGEYNGELNVIRIEI